MSDEHTGDKPSVSDMMEAYALDAVDHARQALGLVRVIGLRKGGKDGKRVWPPVKVYKRLTNGPEDNVWAYLHALLQDYW